MPYSSLYSLLPSFPTRERGLKCLYLIMLLPPHYVVPHAGTWIEIFSTSHNTCYHLSFPTRERGLKCDFGFFEVHSVKSFPTRERGLKSNTSFAICRICIVVPHAGTWIEMYQISEYTSGVPRRSPRGNVD